MTQKLSETERDHALGAFERGVKANSMRAAVVATMPENLPETVAKRLLANGIAPLRGFGPATAAIRAAADVGLAWRSPVSCEAKWPSPSHQLFGK